MDIFDPKQLALIQADPEENASLQTLLTKNNLPLLELLSIKNIQPKIRSNFTYFIKHCQQNQDFCFNLIDIGIKCPMHQGANENMKQACYIAADALTCDQDVVADLLILPDHSRPRKRKSGNQSDQFEEIQQNIETQANNSQVPQQNQAIEESLSPQQKFSNKYKYLVRILDYVGQNQAKNLDQNSINYMIKSLNCLIRKKAEEFMDFLTQRPEVLNRLIQLSYFSSISQFLIKILSDDQIQGQNPEKIKTTIIKGVLNKIIESIKQQEFADRLDFLEQLFQTNKYASEDDRTQLQKMSDVFASKETIQFFYEHLINPATPNEFTNSVAYLNCITKRMNVDQEIDPYSYTNELKEETMIFEVDVLFKEFPSILRQGYVNLNNLQYTEPYKQKLTETRFYELLVLLSRNSRFNNCLQKKPKLQTSILKGNNIILSSIQQKIAILKQLLKQFATQSKNGINRICLIALIEKVLIMQIYQAINHPNESKDLQLTNQNQTQTQPKTQQLQNKIENTLNSSAQAKQKQSSQQEQLMDGQDKKTKINKIKAGLKLNIKKFSLQAIEPTEKKEEQKQIQTKEAQAGVKVKKLQSSFKKEEVLEILKNFSSNLKSNSSLGALQIKKKQKSKETQMGALINKLLMIFSNTIKWSQNEEDIVKAEKQKYIQQIQNMFTYFNFASVSKSYSVTLATTKHPNASAKEKTNPELTFTTQFIKFYTNKKQLSPKPSNQNGKKNLELSDSDFRSDQEEINAVKCSIQDFKKFTGFRLETDSPKKTQPDTSIVPQLTQKQHKPNNLQTPNNQIAQKPSRPQEISILQNNQTTEQTKNQNLNQQLEPKVVASPEQKKICEDKKTKEEGKKAQGVPFQFYIKHRMILA